MAIYNTLEFYHDSLVNIKTKIKYITFTQTILENMKDYTLRKGNQFKNNYRTEQVNVFD